MRVDPSANTNKASLFSAKALLLNHLDPLFFITTLASISVARLVHLLILTLVNGTERYYKEDRKEVGVCCGFAREQKRQKKTDQPQGR